MNRRDLPAGRAPFSCLPNSRLCSWYACLAVRMGSASIIFVTGNETAWVTYQKQMDTRSNTKH